MDQVSERRSAGGGQEPLAPTVPDPYEGPVAHVDLSALAHNVARVRARLADGVKVLAAVKANGYGHGLPGTALALEAEGVEWFGVATPSEALALRRGGVAGGVLLLTPVHDAAVITRLVAQDVSLVVSDEEAVTAVARSDLPRAAKVHLKVDTGMGRLGVAPGDAPRLARVVDADRRLTLEGVFTHLAASDEPDRSATLRQLEAFEAALLGIRDEGIEPGLRHAANSAAIVAYPDHHFDMVRPGISLYGYYPSAHVAALEPGLKQVMRFEAPVTFVKRVRAGTSVSYGGLWRAPRDTLVATVRAGYADGYRRGLSGKAWVGHDGARLEVVGRVCMDQLMLDVGEHPLEVGDRVVLWGPGGPDAEALAESIGTVSYELLTGVAERVRRSYEP